MKYETDPWPAGEWRCHLAAVVRDLDELLELLEIDEEALGVDATVEACRRFPLRVPRGFVARMRRGDPLIVPDKRLAEVAAALAAIPHLRRLRIHTRLPVVLPERVDEALVDWIGVCPVPVVVVVHANHANEIDRSVIRALGVLGAAGATLLNQAVLLRGVNDSSVALEALSKRLFDCGVLPYYLHLLDRVAGAAHFEVDEQRALELMDELRARLPGYLVPRLVREVDGAPSKVVVSQP